MENSFNSQMAKWLKKSQIHYVKVCDRTTVGISDFLIWHEGMSVSLETKWIGKLPVSDSANILKHPFTKPQIRFLIKMAQSGNRGFGLICVDPNKEMLLVTPESLNDSGNITLGQYKKYRKVLPCFPRYDFKPLFREMFYCYDKIG